MTDVRQLPEAFLLKMQELLGEEFGQYLESFKEEWKPGLRVNTLKLSPGELAELVPWNLEPVPWADNGFYYDGTLDGEVLRPSKHPAYYAGLYYLQEPSAMTPAAMLPVVPGDRVLDLCAAPGGKSTELASKLKGRGMLVSNDISYSRARALLKNLELAGAANICVTSEAPEKLAGVWPEFFDKILVDAPCSGEGMFRRDEDMVKDWNEKGPEYYVPIQRQILSQAAAMLRPGGYMLYSTCTFSVEEDEGNVAYVLEEFPQMQLCCLDLDKVPGACGGFGLSGCMRLFPYRLKGEGHFLALLKKSEDAPETRIRLEPPTRMDKKNKAVLEEFFRDCRWKPDWERVQIKGEKVYLVPELPAKLNGIHFLRNGLYLGDLKKNRFEPSQQLAMTLKASDYAGSVSLSPEDERIGRYLRGETLLLEPGEATREKGWILVCVDQYALGWGRLVNGVLKNKYWSGWRLKS